MISGYLFYSLLIRMFMRLFHQDLLIIRKRKYLKQLLKVTSKFAFRLIT